MITLKDAQKIVEGCLNKAREENMKPVTIAVLDTRCTGKFCNGG